MVVANFIEVLIWDFFFGVIKPVKQRLVECETLTGRLWSTTGKAA